MSNFTPVFSRQRRYRPRNPIQNAAPEKVEAWKQDNPDLWKWIDENASRSNDFACSLNVGLRRYGSLTVKQAAAVRRNIERAEERKQGTLLLDGKFCEIDAIEVAFERAKAAGLSRPKLTFGVFRFNPAGRNSVNPGAIYVKDADNGTYYGKVQHGKFVRSYSCDAETEKAILEACADPHNAAVAHGKEFGKCSACNCDLTDPKSVALSMGPVCAKNYGWV